SVSLGKVEVRRKPGRDYAELALSLPRTRIAGRVVDPEGKPLPGARVDATQSGGSGLPERGHAVADSEGRFEMLGLPEGNYTVMARFQEEATDALPVLLDSHLDSPELQLALRRNRTLDLLIESPLGPLGGARVLGLPDLLLSSSGRLDETLSGLDGRARLQIPADANWVSLVVSAPGWATRLLRQPLLPAGAEARVLLSETGGALFLDLSAASGPAGGGLHSKLVLLFFQDAAVPAPVLARVTDLAFGRAAPGRLELSNFAPGEYALCTGVEATRAWRGGLGPPDSGCERGYLAPGATLALRAPG
ncbi:MAG TPA: carboxypeptidase-like regulatory domain-containing protein, partial [Thermoanaerobaculia bacterium]|nr:carboxypeptidase-like regulatory domain-containing protein [Thermoanaerobaculia bacterium]